MNPSKDDVLLVTAVVMVFNLIVVSDQRDESKIESQGLTNESQDGKLHSDASRHAAGPHLKAGIGIGSFHGSTDGIIPDVHNPVPPNEGSIKESDVLDKGVKDQPINQNGSDRNENEPQAQPDQQFVGRITKL